MKKETKIFIYLLIFYAINLSCGNMVYTIFAPQAKSLNYTHIRSVEEPRNN